jgi:hypothetical protein
MISFLRLLVSTRWFSPKLILSSCCYRDEEIDEESAAPQEGEDEAEESPEGTDADGGEFEGVG